MTSTKAPSTHNEVLERLAEEIDIPDGRKKEAIERYESVGAWLNRPESGIADLDPQIYPQGSFLLGTVVRPVGDAEDYDLDLVCRLEAAKTDMTMAELKVLVGKEVKAYAKVHDMKEEPEDKRRCWTLEYADGARFHMDILPALPDEQAYRERLYEQGANQVYDRDELVRDAIAITDDTHPSYKEICHDWPQSNPKGYAVWFQDRQRVVVQYRKQMLVEAGFYESIADVPEHAVKTPLQRSIQLLKRHRDVTYGADEDKPISIIITTLAARAYQGEADVREALATILEHMDEHVGQKDGQAFVPNPVNPGENFADKWAETPRKAEIFGQWLIRARKDFGRYLRASAYDEMPETLRESMTQKTADKVLSVVGAPSAGVTSFNIGAAKAEAEEIIREGRETRPWCG